MEANLSKNLETLFKQMENFITSKTVVGEPINIGDMIILPLVDVSFGVAAGASQNKDKDNGAGGLGAKVTPSAVLIIRDGKTEIMNLQNQNSLNKLIDMAPSLLSKFNIKTKDEKKDKTLD